MKREISVVDVTPLTSHSARGAWIETLEMEFLEAARQVALREGCVD